MILFYGKALERDICLESFYDFFLRFWPVISPEKLVVNWHIKVLCDEVQGVGERVIRREAKEYDLCINVPPGTTKSSIVSIAFPAWLWAKDPTLKIMCGSHSYKLSIDLADKCRRLCQSEKYLELFPEVELSKEGLEEFQTSKGGERLALSVGSAPIGRHAHIHIFDDLLDSKDAASMSETALKGCRTWIMEVMPSRSISKALTPFILLMQRLSIGDPTDVVMERAAAGGTPIRFICLPAELSDLVRPRSLRSNYVEGLLDPVRLNRQTLDVAKVDLGQYAYPGQYMQTPILAGKGMFRTEKIEIIREYPNEINFEQIVRFWDKAGTDRGGAWTAGVKIGRKKDGHFVILDVVRFQKEAAERERIIKQTAIADGRKVVIGVEQEPGSGGKESAQATVRNLAGFIVWVDRPVGNKIARADAFATQVNEGMVSAFAGPWLGPYLQELGLFWFGPYKDQVDASSGAFNRLVMRLRVGALPQMPIAQPQEQPVNAKVVA